MMSTKRSSPTGTAGWGRIDQGLGATRAGNAAFSDGGSEAQRPSSPRHVDGGCSFSPADRGARKRPTGPRTVCRRAQSHKAQRPVLSTGASGPYEAAARSPVGGGVVKGEGDAQENPEAKTGLHRARVPAPARLVRLGYGGDVSQQHLLSRARNDRPALPCVWGHDTAGVAGSPKALVSSRDIVSTEALGVP